MLSTGFYVTFFVIVCAQAELACGVQEMRKSSIFQALTESSTAQLDYTEFYKLLILMSFLRKRPHSKSDSARSAGSIPARGTIFSYILTTE